MSAETTETTTSWVVTCTPTIMDGFVVRWYRSEAAAQMGNEIVSASRNGVRVNTFIGTGDAYRAVSDLLVHAWAVMRMIQRGEDVRHLATHRLSLLGGDIERIVPGVTA